VRFRCEVWIIDGHFGVAYDGLILCGEDALGHNMSCDIDDMRKYNKK
jgi:hypothetical protein